MPVAIMECGDYSEFQCDCDLETVTTNFQEALKNMRKVDDIIINTINSTLPTDSFHPNTPVVCKELHEKITEGNVKRESTIKNCITHTAENVRKLREQREEEMNNTVIAKSLRDEQTKLRMLQVELSVEELVKQRTAKVFNERCRKYFKPE